MRGIRDGGVIMAVAELTHPTIPHRLPPGAILDTAKADIERVKRNDELRRRRKLAEKKGEAWPEGELESYGFPAELIRKAHENATVLLGLALQRLLERKGQPTKKMARILCADPDALRQAIDLASDRRP